MKASSKILAATLSLLAGPLLLPAAAQAADAAPGTFMPMAVSVTKARQLCFTDTLQVAGRLVAREEIPVRPDAEGMRVTELLVEDGDKVTAGQLLARLGRTEGLPPSTDNDQVVAPVSGIVLAPAPPSARLTRAQPLFRIIMNGEIEAEIDVPAVHLSGLSVGQRAQVESTGLAQVDGRLRAIAPDVDPATQVARVRVSFSSDQPLHVGSFAKASIERGRRCGPAVPLTAVLYSAEGAVVQIVHEGRVETQPVRIGLLSGAYVEIREGLAVEDVVVRRAGTFLREGDSVRQVLADDPI